MNIRNMAPRQAPEIRGFSSLSIPGITVSEFVPGVTLHLLDNGTQAANRISVYFSRGTSATDVRPASALMPALMTEGTSTLSGAEIAEAVDFAGAFLRPLSSTHFSGLSVISPNDTTLSLVPLLADMLTSPSFPAKAFEAARQKAAMSRRLDLSKPKFLAATALSSNLCGASHPYQGPSSPEDIERVTVDEVRFAHSQARRTPVNIFAAGRLSEDILKAIEELALRLQPSDVSQVAPVVPYVPDARMDIRICSETAAEQAAVACGMPAIPRSHPDYDELRHTVVALGGYFGSRLMTNIREEKGLTYGINAALMGSQEGASVQISAQCDNAYANRVIDEIRNELRLLGETLMSEDELRRVRADITSGLASRLDSSFSIIDYYETNLMVGIPDGYFTRQFETIRDLTPERLRHLAATHLNPSSLTTVCITAPHT